MIYSSALQIPSSRNSSRSAPARVHTERFGSPISKHKALNPIRPLTTVRSVMPLWISHRRL